MDSLNAQLKALLDAEAQKKKDDPTYAPKTYEILEGEIREVTDDEGARFYADPASFPESVQRKYTGTTLAAWRPAGDFVGDVPDGFEEYQAQYRHPFTGEAYFRRAIRPLPYPQNAVLAVS